MEIGKLTVGIICVGALITIPSLLPGHHTLGHRLVSRKELRPSMDPLKDQKVEEVHATQDEQYETDLIGQRLDRNLSCINIDSDLQCKRNIAEVNQIKTDH